jgi:hypothetical protein
LKDKRFFFEKKKQKTSAPAGAGTTGANAPNKPKFFCFFLFTKRRLFLLFVRIFRTAARFLPAPTDWSSTPRSLPASNPQSR